MGKKSQNPADTIPGKKIKSNMFAIDFHECFLMNILFKKIIA